MILSRAIDDQDSPPIFRLVVSPAIGTDAACVQESGVLGVGDLVLAHAEILGQDNLVAGLVRFAIQVAFEAAHLKRPRLDGYGLDLQDRDISLDGHLLFRG